MLVICQANVRLMSGKKVGGDEPLAVPLQLKPAKRVVESTCGDMWLTRFGK